MRKKLRKEDQKRLVTSLSNKLVRQRKIIFLLFFQFFFISVFAQTTIMGTIIQSALSLEPKAKQNPGLGMIRSMSFLRDSPVDDLIKIHF